MLFSFDITSDKSGKLHAVFHLSQHLTKPPFCYYYTCYENGTWSTPHTLLPEHLFDFSKAGREVVLTATQDSLQVIFRAREQGAEDFSLYRMTRPLLSE